MWNDTDLQHHIERELEWEPSVHPRQIGVVVKNGAVHLDGHVDSFWEKCMAEIAVWRIAHIRSVANEIRVELPFAAQREDDDLALSAMAILESHCLVPSTAEVQVANGIARLTGHVSWHHQCEAAEIALRALKGLRGLKNDITVQPGAPIGDAKTAVEEAFKRSALVDSSRIKVHVAQDTVSLRGVARTHAEHQAALHIARSAPGVAKVEDHIAIG